jgi:hypothetical protein
MAFFKALIPATLLTWVVCIILGTNGSKGGFLYIKLVTVSLTSMHGGIHSFYWSWALFIAALGLCFGIFKMLE